MTVLVAVDSESGNTYEMALEVAAALRDNGADVLQHRINGPGSLPAPLRVDLAFVGTYTWGYGEPPAATERFMREHALDCPVAAFGSGETQWGEEHFCGAVDRLIGHYGSPFPGFRQEQMPNSRQRAELRAWARHVLAAAKGAAGAETETQELIAHG